MNFVPSPLLKTLTIAAAIGLIAMSNSAVPQPAPVEPIAYIGHGSFFDARGNQIVPTLDFVARAQDYYRSKLLASLDSKAKQDFALFERRLDTGVRTADLKIDAQAGLVIRQRALDWLVANATKIRADGRTIGKINALKYRLTFTLPAEGNRKSLKALDLFRLDPAIAKRLGLPDFKPGGAVVFLSTVNSGQAYINECAANGVPIPPSIGVLDPNGMTGWKTEGFIPIANQFIGQNNGPSPAEIRSFQNAQGMCFALPRYTSPSKNYVGLDGVICLSKTTSKVCIWDNQMNGNGFPFAAGTQIPIGKPDLSVNSDGLYQAGGFELENGSGGVCTDCHAGENPYIIHPDVEIAPNKTMQDMGITLPTFAPNRYVPIVPASWPQNDSSQVAALVPGACVNCHVKGPGNAGRFPHLSLQYNGTLADPSGYCNTILNQAVAGGFGAPATMPQNDPGGSVADQEVIDFRAMCNQDPSANPADLGDPHLTTTNGVHYDFQAAGEFTALRNSDTGFELQTRQTPVTTTFVPGPNAYTGLASCVSLNTAVGVRIGKHRVTYQPGASVERMQLRIDGRAVSVPASGITVSSGNRITNAGPSGALNITLADRTKLLITPTFWASQGYWYLDIQVLNTRAREGTMGYIPHTSWLPLKPGGGGFGARPVSLAARYVALNQSFANAWRVSSATSVFDYAPGTTTASFTDTGWPPKPGTGCTAAKAMPGIPNRTPAKGMDREAAVRLCRPVQDKNAFDNCVFDAMVMGNPAAADGYRRGLAQRIAAM